MSNRFKLSLLFGFLMAFSFITSSVMNGEFDTSEEIRETLIAVTLAGVFSGLLLYIFIKESQVDKFFGKNKREE